ncbi:MAG: class I SAM-dependent methyltransferase [Microlunatus sp.]|nr:class I SAM-dependent methyltransferase [Microlunatus sp.]
MSSQQPAARIRPIEAYAEIDWQQVEHVTVICFPSGGEEMIMVRTPDGFRVPAGAVEPGEDVELDSVLRIPLQTAGFRRQGTHPAGISGDRRRALFWVDGSRYHGNREHRSNADWWIGPAARAAGLLRDQGDDELAELVELADRHRSRITDAELAEDSRRLLDAAYLRADTAEGGSGFGGTPEEWRQGREQICDAIESDGSFLDIGCANGLLMSSVVDWSAERGHRVEPYGVDHSPALVDLARRRLPHWADRIFVGDALTWTHPDGLRFDVVAVLTDIVPERRHADLLRHLLDRVVTPGGRLLLNSYGGPPQLSGAAVLHRHGYPVDGMTAPPARGRPDDQPGAWVINRG